MKLWTLALVVGALCICMAGEVAAQVRVETLATGFSASGDVAVGPDGSLFVGNYGSSLNDSTGSTVTRITLDGQVSTFATGLNGASGNVFDADGNLYQSSIRDAQVVRITPDGTTEVYASGIGGGVIGLAFDSAGNLYANSCGQNQIYRITPDRAVSVFASGAPLSCPNGLTSDPEDNLYAVNFDNGIVSRIDPSGNITQLARTPPGVFRSSGGNGHVTYGNGRLYTVSNATGQVFEIFMDGTMNVIAGTGQRGHDDGDPLEASFQMPNGIDVSADGRRLYLNESESLSGGMLTGTYPLTPNRLRVVVLEDAPAINVGMSGGWFAPEYVGQGFMINVIPQTSTLFVAWFTFRPDGDSASGNDHRWYTLQGPYSGAGATLEIFSTSGGRFDSSEATQTVSIGTATLEFASCERAMMTYDIPAESRSGTATLQPLLSSSLCESLAGEMQ